MLIKRTPQTRRGFLRGTLNGAAVAVALPFLNIDLDGSGTALAATGESLPTRFGTWFWGLGIDREPFTPKKAGLMTAMTPQLAPLEKVREHVNVFTNYNVVTDGLPNLCHFTGWVALRTGAAPNARDALPGRSLDVPIADVIGGATRFRNINMAATGEPRDSYSFLSADSMNPPEISAVEMYRKLFGPGFQDPNAPEFTPDPALMTRKSVLSAVTDARRDFASGLGAEDKQRLDHYFSAIRDLEQRLDVQLQKPAPAPQCKVPEAAKDQPAGVDVLQVKARHRAMTDLLVMALACNQTRVFNMLYSGSGSTLIREGSDMTHHFLTHTEAVDPTLGCQPISSKFLADAMGEMGYFLEKLASMPEGSGTVLDNSLVYMHSDCENAKVHSIDRIPMLTAGRLGGKVKTGLHIDGNGQPGTRLGYTIQKLFDVPLGSWGTNSMQVSQEIGEILA